MGSRRRLLAALAIAVLAAVAAASALARRSDDGRDVATGFLTALVSGDSKVACGLLSTNAVANAGGPARCERSLRDYAAFSLDDFEALRTLYEAHEAAQTTAHAHGGNYVTKRFKLRDLARAIERAEPSLTVKLGRGPSSASGQLDSTVILDQRSTARRLVLYSEADDGSIWRLSAPNCGSPDYEEVAQGVPESRPKDPSSLVKITSLTPLDQGRVFVRAELKLLDIGEAPDLPVALVLVTSQTGHLVDDLLFSTLTAAFDSEGESARTLTGSRNLLARAVAGHHTR